MATMVKGDSSAHETWESGALSNGEIRTMEIVETGPYAELKSRLPRKNGTYKGYRVANAALRPLRGGRGRMSVTCRLSRKGGDEAGGGGLLDSVVEIEMAQDELDVRTLLGGTESYVSSLAAWEDAPARLKKDFKYENANGGEEELAGQARSVAALILSGIQSYIRHHPVVIKTTFYDEEPDSKPVDGLDRVGGEPPGSPAGYEYLKSGDHWVQSRDGSWQRVEQWTGAKKWNGSLYRGGSGAPLDMSLLED